MKTNPRKWRQIRGLVLGRDHRTCYYCGGLATEVDHFISRKHSGSDSFNNLVAACRDCNEEKGTLDGSVFLEMKRLQNAGDRKNSPLFHPITGDYSQNPED